MGKRPRVMVEVVPEPTLTGYARVSTAEQSLDLQINALVRAGVSPDAIYTEKVSGVSSRRPGRDVALKRCRAGDTFVVWKLDRVGRSLMDLLQFVQRLEDRGIKFRSLQDNIDTATPAGRMMLAMLGAMAQFERDLIAERTKAGVRAAMERGVKFGQPSKMTKAVRAEFERRWKAGETVSQIAQATKISEPTYRRYYPRAVLDKLRGRPPRKKKRKTTK